MRKSIDETAGRVGNAMRAARQACRLSVDYAARLMRIMPNELLEYERGTTKIPTEVLNHAFVLSYKMMHFRIVENIYRRQRSVFRKIQTVMNNSQK